MEPFDDGGAQRASVRAGLMRVRVSCADNARSEVAMGRPPMRRLCVHVLCSVLIDAAHARASLGCRPAVGVKAHLFLHPDDGPSDRRESRCETLQRGARGRCSWERPLSCHVCLSRRRASRVVRSRRRVPSFSPSRGNQTLQCYRRLQQKRQIFRCRLLQQMNRRQSLRCGPLQQAHRHRRCRCKAR
jgi:hypothetical protein